MELHLLRLPIIGEVKMEYWIGNIDKMFKICKALITLKSVAFICMLKKYFDNEHPFNHLAVGLKMHISQVQLRFGS